jgi:two-component system nitrate/nitrite response regulator NarL
MTGSANSIRVVIADERATFRQALRTLLELETDLTIVGEASDARAIAALAQQVKPDIILIDVALFYRLKSRTGTLPEFRTMVMVPTVQRVDIIEAFLRGARAVVPKPSPSHIWCESIRTVRAGQYWLVDESIAIIVQTLQERFPHESGSKYQSEYGLTPRETEIVDKIAQGNSNREVGQAFSICEKTVKHHLTRIFAKVGVSSRLELALFALKHPPLRLPSYRKATLTEGHDRNHTRRTKRNGKGFNDT